MALTSARPLATFCCPKCFHNALQCFYDPIYEPPERGVLLPLRQTIYRPQAPSEVLLPGMPDGGLA